MVRIFLAILKYCILSVLKQKCNSLLYSYQFHRANDDRVLGKKPEPHNPRKLKDLGGAEQLFADTELFLRSWVYSKVKNQYNVKNKQTLKFTDQRES